MKKLTFYLYQFVLSTIYTLVDKKELLDFSNNIIRTYEMSKNNKSIFKNAFDSQIEFINLRERIKEQLDGSDRRAVLGLLNVIGWTWNRPDSQKVYNNLLKVKTFKRMFINYIPLNDLNKRYAYLAYSNGLRKNESKVYYVSKDLFILQSLEHDRITLKAFCSYKGATKRLLKSDKPLNYNKFKGLSEKYHINSCINWDNIQLMQDEERIYFYSFLKRPEVGLNKSERNLLKRINRYSGGDTFSLYLEKLEKKVSILKDAYEHESTYQNYDAFMNAQRELWSATEEQNATTPKTTINDYK